MLRVFGACRVHAALDDQERALKHLTQDGFLVWSRRMPGMAKALRSLPARAAGPAAGSSAPQEPGGAAGPPRPAEGAAGPGEEGGRPAGPGPAPRLEALKGGDPGPRLLSRAWAWALAGSGLLAPGRCRRWRLLFSSQAHGQSFSTFMGRWALWAALISLAGASVTCHLPLSLMAIVQRFSVIISSIKNHQARTCKS